MLEETKLEAASKGSSDSCSERGESTRVSGTRPARLTWRKRSMRALECWTRKSQRLALPCGASQHPPLARRRPCREAGASPAQIDGPTWPLLRRRAARHTSKRTCASRFKPQRTHSPCRWSLARPAQKSVSAECHRCSPSRPRRTLKKSPNYVRRNVSDATPERVRKEHPPEPPTAAAASA